MVNGVAATIGSTGNATIATSMASRYCLESTTGDINVAVGTTPGTYSVVYELCDKLSQRHVLQLPMK
jgi:hypothetical protein